MSDEVIEALRVLVERTKDMANRTGGLNPALRQPWLKALQDAEKALYSHYGRALAKAKHRAAATDPTGKQPQGDNTPDGVTFKDGGGYVR